ncbi:MAG: type I-B CRISPR-associated protein Cas8b1/Cst1 [Thermoanaerobacterium sp.]|nr:type I-B CRISPR-associated protein Cas8b1/Cst1 [Thermoanaerobacterium sp.]
MQIRIYTSDWFYNMGIVGLIRILEHARRNNKDVDYRIKQDYLEFDSRVIAEFHNYYFDYFYDEYVKSEYKDIMDEFSKLEEASKAEDIATKIEEFLSNNKLDDKASKKGYEDSINLIKDKIKTLKQNYEQNQLEAVLNEVKGLLNNKDIVEKYALDYLRSILYDNFFGQMSFLQKNLSNKSINDHKEIMFKDFIRPLLIDLNVTDLINNNDFDALNGFIQEHEGKEQNLKIYKRCLKKSKNQKEKFISELKSSNNLCSICNSYFSFGEDFNESRFLILGVSNQNALNFFWNFENRYPICNLCKLVILCAPAGVVRFIKPYIEVNRIEDWWKRIFYVFVNLDTNLMDLFKKNELLKNKMNSDNPYKEFIMDILEQAREESIWTLQNILFVEFNGQYQSKKSNLKYMYISKFTAKYFINYSSDTLGRIRDYRFKVELMDGILDNKDLNSIIFKQLKLMLKNNFDGLDIYYATMSKALLDCIKKEGDEKKVRDKVYRAFYSGKEMRAYLSENKSDNRISSIAYRLLNTAKVGNKKDFMDTVMRLYINSEMEMPRVLLEAFYEGDIDFETLAQSYIAGLITTDVKEDSKNE